MGRSIQAIIGGVASGTEHDAVVILTTFSGGQRVSLCTATMVAPNLLVTARHCVSNVDSSTVCAMDGSPISGSLVKSNRTAAGLAIFVGKDGVAPSSEVEANAVAHGSKIIVDSSTTVCNHDVAFVVTDKNLDAPVAPIRLGPPTMDEHVSAIGWGVDASGTLTPSRTVRADIALIGVGPALYPDTTQNWGYGDAEFMIGESACSGDSGSPAFSKGGAVVGIAARTGNGQAKTSNLASTCMGSSAHAVYTHLGKYPNLVDAAFKEANQPKWLEGQPNPWQAPPATGTPNAPAAPGTEGASAAPATNPDGTSAAPGTPAAATGPDGKPAAPAPGATGTRPDGSGDGGGGCSMSSEPQHGSVEYAAGIVAILAIVFGLRRRFRKTDEDEAPLPESTREPYESVI